MRGSKPGARGMVGETLADSRRLPPDLCPTPPSLARLFWKVPS